MRLNRWQFLGIVAMAVAFGYIAACNRAKPELDALAGTERHLKQFEVILLEVSVLRIGHVPIFADVAQHMEARGYRIYDVLPQYYRPRDGALWQMDVFYVRNDSALVASRSWN